MRKWMAYNAEFLEDQEVVRITNEEFVEVARDDLDGRIDISITVSTAEDNAARVEQLSFLLQTIGNDGDPRERRELMADIYDLMNMPDEAKRRREYEPEPDPMAEQAKQIELESLQLANDKLRADIAAQYASAKEDEADRVEKLSTAKNMDARTAKLIQETALLSEKTDAEALKFIRDEQADGELGKHERELEKMNLKRLENLDQMAFQAQVGSDKEQIGVLN